MAIGINHVSPLFTTPYASRAGALRAGKKSGLDVADIKIEARDGKHFVIDQSRMAHVAASSPLMSADLITKIVPIIDPAPVDDGSAKLADLKSQTPPHAAIKPDSKKGRVLYMMRNGGAGVAEIVSELKITVSAAASLVSDVKRMGVTVKAERKDGRAIYTA